MSYERTERPKWGGKAKYDYDAIRATADHGDAVVIPLNGVSAEDVASTIRYTMAGRGYRVRARQTPLGLVVWCELRA